MQDLCSKEVMVFNALGRNVVMFQSNADRVKKLIFPRHINQQRKNVNIKVYLDQFIDSFTILGAA